MRVSFPDLAWLDAMQPFKDQADKVVERLMADHPDLTAVEAIADLTEYGGSDLFSPASSALPCLAYAVTFEPILEPA